VQEVFDGAALQQARAGGAGVDADFTGAQVSFPRTSSPGNRRPSR
jgi:hypothetical protein